MTKKILSLFFILVVSIYAYGQKDSVGLRKLPFVRYHNTSIERRMKEGRYLTLHLKTDTGSSFTYTGNIFIADHSSLLMLGGTEEFHGYSDGGNTQEDRITNNPPDQLTVVPHQEIDYISMIPRLRPVFGTLTGVSLATICVLIPLASVGYSSKNFNTGTIVKIAAVSLAVNVALYKIFFIRKYKIKGATN